MSSSAAIHIVGPTEFDRGTAQTPGSERLAAIAPGLGIASATGGACSWSHRDRARVFTITENRRRSHTFFWESATSAGVPEENRSRVRRRAISFICPLPAAHGNQPVDPEAI